MRTRMNRLEVIVQNLEHDLKELREELTRPQGTSVKSNQSTSVKSNQAESEYGEAYEILKRLKSTKMTDRE